MDIITVTPIVISLISLFASLFVGYKTLIQGFSGKIWTAQSVVLTYTDDVPALGLACYVENKGAHAGYLADIRLIVKNITNGSHYEFYPFLSRDDYSIFASYREKDWYPFSGFYLLPRGQSDKFIIFKPKNDQFTAQKGIYQIDIESRWQNLTTWLSDSRHITIEISLEMANKWSQPEVPAYQVHSLELLEKRSDRPT